MSPFAQNLFDAYAPKPPVSIWKTVGEEQQLMLCDTCKGCCTYVPMWKQDWTCSSCLSVNEDNSYDDMCDENRTYGHVYGGL